MIRSKCDRIVEVLRRDPDVTNDALRERFGVRTSTITRARGLAGVPEPDDVSRHHDAKTPERWPRPFKGRE